MARTKIEPSPVKVAGHLRSQFWDGFDRVITRQHPSAMHLEALSEVEADVAKRIAQVKLKIADERLAEQRHG